MVFGTADDSPKISRMRRQLMAVVDEAVEKEALLLQVTGNRAV